MNVYIFFCCVVCLSVGMRCEEKKRKVSEEADGWRGGGTSVEPQVSKQEGGGRGDRCLNGFEWNGVVYMCIWDWRL